MLLPGRLHREAAGDELGPDLASHRGKAKALSSEIGVKADSWPPAGDGRPPMRSSGLMPEKRRKTSAGIFGTTEGSWPGVGHRSAADAIGRLDASENVEASSTEIGRRNQTGGARRSVRRRRAARFARRAPRARPSPAPSRRDGAAGSRLAGPAAIGGGAARLVSARGRRRSLAARFPSSSGSKQQAGRRSQVSSRPAAPSFSKNKVSVPARLLRVLFVIFQVSRSQAAAQERVRGP